LFGLSSFLIVEEMRRGRSPKDAGMEALRRIRANTVEKRLLDAEGNPAFSVKFYVLNRRGEYAGVGMYASHAGKPQTYAVCTEDGPRLLPVEGLLENAPGL
jgi:N4-(beta-N-acetylglucosaminyl)-L-asparaginase